MVYVSRTAFQVEGRAYVKGEKLEKCWHFQGNERISAHVEPGSGKER